MILPLIVDVDSIDDSRCGEESDGRHSSVVGASVACCLRRKALPFVLTEIKRCYCIDNEAQYKYGMQ